MKEYVPEGTAQTYNEKLTGSITFIPMPPLPEEALKFIEEMQKAAEKATGITK